MNNQVTYIDNSDRDERPQHNHNPESYDRLSPDMRRQVNRFIHPPMTTHPASGMNRYQDKRGVHKNLTTRMDLPHIQQHHHMKEQYVPENKTYAISDFPLNKEVGCMDVHDHIKDCPLCSSYYKNDKSLYIIAIIVLIVIIAILLRKILKF